MNRTLIVATLAWALVSSAALADYLPPPLEYSITDVNNGQMQHIYRSGNRAMVEDHIPPSADQPEIHTATIVDVRKNMTLTWDLMDAKVPCDTPSVGDWGDPFRFWDLTVQGIPGTPKEAGKETVNGIAATVYEIKSPEGDVKFWRENTYGLLVKFVALPKGAPAQVMFELKEFKPGKPAESVFKVPARCTWKG